MQEQPPKYRMTSEYVCMLTQTKNGNHHGTEFYGFLLNFNKVYEFYGSSDNFIIK
jgi:hypothetical protein